jgi:outer membrane protein OmpA-like peptidoglycan-associated protein
MKKVFILFTSFCFFSHAFAQKNDYKKGKSLGVSFFLNDFKSASELRSNGIVSLFKNHDFFSSQMNSGFAVDYVNGLSNHVDFIATLAGSSVNYPVQNVAPFTSKSLLLETTASLNFKLLADNYWLTPFIDVGVGASKYKKYFGAFMPVGLGLQAHLSKNVFLLLNSQYRIAVTENASYHFYHSVGIVTSIGPKKIAPPQVEKEVEIPVVVDRDHDGIVDSLDACPDQAGIAAFHGCPDTDGDGIPDKDDKCPKVAGLAKYQGCPIPDTDKDGINDEEDRCPNVPGVARYQGCPVPDTDNDGVNDEEDKCPNEVGDSSNFGCPIIDSSTVQKVNAAAKNIFFASSKGIFLSASNAPLQKIVKILNENPVYKVEINGYTDSREGHGNQQLLSEERANAVKDYLVKKGIDADRITTKGYGSENPIADNNTVIGRGKNRRVDIELKSF